MRYAPFQVLRLLGTILMSVIVGQAAIAQVSNAPKPTSQDNRQQVAEPQLIPQPFVPSGDKCKKKRHDSISIAVTIDEMGDPKQAHPLAATGSAAEELAAQIVMADHFIPARWGDAPIGVTRMIVVEMNTCTGKITRDDGQKKERTWLKALPVQTIRPLPAGSSAETAPFKVFRVGENISPPVPISAPEAHYTEEARRANLRGECAVRVIVGANGLPQDARVIRPLGMGLDEEALKAVMKYKFRPAKMNGKEPVPVMITVVVNFR